MALLVDRRMIGKLIMNDLSMESEIAGIIDGVDGFQHCFTQSVQNYDVMTIPVRD
jgi:hypothetical protein